jgi:hypothetical protein
VFPGTIVYCNYSNISTIVFVVCLCVFVPLPSLWRNKRTPRQSNQASAVLTSRGFAAHNIRPVRYEGSVHFCIFCMHQWHCKMPKIRLLANFIAVPKFGVLFFCSSLSYIVMNTFKFHVIYHNGVPILSTLCIYFIYNKKIHFPSSKKTNVLALFNNIDPNALTFKNRASYI